MIHDEMRGLQKYLSPPPTPFFKRQVPLIEDEETKKSKDNEFIENVITTLEKQHIKNEFAFIIAPRAWDISSVKTEDGYIRKEDMGRIS